ncbi:tRNA (adenosine(37)-N6)-threonylcarbamoyltransferase complex dimerization subunit type 1 TsaB [Paenibacillus thalictri]|uniref:tRNA (Adenosine(37)-N6)-threonylcarbamoyltransferase complex dimerization subunit type 1 TsaB n=1 Tax=Paenibacillus thalictri TaxID=2527873 RepID=A0A4Q9DQK0_9BACL|nr:tRNA (adenosine(37)-N6)-threonylcarbamoyltransferase complex dimerization subunit type 1 TsaB [Paenibacillus thalictri]TBL78698.1 tRNA (adenosine(37)-N6)-threonylcarbamoyltransferase complex dimerization subunit type 1 TsaB [Paenibacillus thalictri]
MIQTTSTHPILLALDTSTADMSVALFRGDELLLESSSHVERNHSMYLIPAIQEMLVTLGLKPADIEAVAAGVGPGSYTGIRIGVTVAKTFAWTRNLPLIGVSSLEALALGACRLPEAQETRKCWVVPLMDARRGQAFSAVYETGESGLRCVAPDAIRLIAPWVEELAQMAGQESSGPDRVLFVGETGMHMDSLQRFSELYPSSSIVAGHALQAQDVGRLALVRLQQGQTEDIHGFVPNYTQLPEAEVKLKQKASDV